MTKLIGLAGCSDKRWPTAGLLSSMALLMAPAALAQNLVVNPDFESGNMGFGSDYTYVATNPNTSGDCTPDSMYDPFTYTVGTNPRNFHTAWASFGDHTSGSGNMMIVNAAAYDKCGQQGDVWRQNISLTQGAEYEFSYWARLSYPVAPPLLQVNVNGAEIGRFDASATSTTEWTKVTHKFVASVSGSQSVRIVDLRPVYQGDDYVIDDLSLVSLIVPVTINVHPNSDPNPLNLSSGGTTPVAILGSADFDVSQIVIESLRLGDAEVKVVGKSKDLCAFTDVGSYDADAFDKLGAPDGVEDLVCHFITADIFTESDEVMPIFVTGELYDGTKFAGEDIVKIVKQ